MKPISRREFLTKTGALTAAAAVSTDWPSVGHSNPSGLPAGIQLYAVKDALIRDPAATLRQVREIGYREVETAGFAGLTALEFRQLLDESGLQCPSAHLQFDKNNWGPTFDEAHALGASYAASGSLRSGLGMQFGSPTSAVTLDEIKKTAELANRIGEKAKQAGLQYAYHNHGGELADVGGGTKGYDLLLQETDPELVKFEIDCGWMVLGGGNPIEYFQRFPNRFPMIHVKDFLPPPERQAGAELGHGVIDYRPIFAAAEKAKLQHYFAEQEGPFVRMTQIEAARQAFHYLRSIT